MKTRSFGNSDSIAGRLRLGFGLFFLLVAIIMTTWLWSVHQINQARTTISNCIAIERTVLNMDRLLEKARRLHGDFFLQYDRIGLNAAHVQFAQPSIRLVAEAVSASSDLKKMIAHSRVGKRLRSHQVDINLYLASAKRFADTSIQSIELITRLAAPNHGLEASFEQQLARLQTLSATAAPLAALIPRAQLAYQEYRVNRQRHLMQSVFNTLTQYNNLLDTADPALLERRDELRAMTTRLRVTGEETLAIDAEIKNKFNDFNLQTNTAQPIARMLIDEAAKEVAAAKEMSEQTINGTLLSLAFCLLGTLVTGFVISRFITRTVTRRIQALTQCATKVQQGQLNINAEEDPADEIGQLGKTLNLMSGRIHSMVDQLEQTIAERTSQLRNSEHRFRSIADQLPHVGIIGLDDHGRVFFWNRASHQLYGISDAEARGHRLEELIIDEEGRSLLAAQLSSWMQREQIMEGERIFRHQDGTSVPVYVAALHLQTQEGRKEFYSIHLDLSELKQAEQQKLAIEAQLQRSRKMEAIGLLAGGVAHDLNNILSGIVSYPDLILMQLPPDSKLYKPILAIQESGQRAAAVVADLLTVARGVSSEKKLCSLNQVVNQYLHSPEHEALLERYPGIECRSECAKHLWPLSCSLIHLRKSLMNLVTNAAEAIEKTGLITVRTDKRELTEVEAQARGVSPGVFILLEVADSGPGIAKEDLDHIFEPFYSRKVMGRSGTGLGLAVVWNTIQDHHGAIEVSSTDRGTKFTLYFPATEQEALVMEDDVNNDILKGHGETVLVVDDEPLQREIATQILDTLGYHSQAMASGEEAVEYLQDHAVDLILLDMIMGTGINGRETYARIIRRHPGQKALIVSGFSENEEVRAALQMGVSAYLQKPYAISSLSKAVATALQTSP